MVVIHSHEHLFGEKLIIRLNGVKKSTKVIKWGIVVYLQMGIGQELCCLPILFIDAFSCITTCTFACTNYLSIIPNFLILDGGLNQHADNMKAFHGINAKLKLPLGM